VVAEPVCSELVSARENPRSAGNYQGIFDKSGGMAPVSAAQRTEITALFGEFPYARDQGIFSAEQGSEIVEQGTAVSVHGRLQKTRFVSVA
jgi:hypothetical protein